MRLPWRVLFRRPKRWSAQDDETVKMLREERAESLTETRRLRRIDVAKMLAESRTDWGERWNNT